MADPNKPPHLPYELILKIMTLNLPSGSSDLFNHTTPSALKTMFVTKMLYKDGQSILKNDGSWKLVLDLTEYPSQLQVPPMWILQHITNLALDIYMNSLRVNDAQAAIVDSQIAAVRTACPKLESIFVTLGVPPFDMLRTLVDIVDGHPKCFARLITPLIFHLPSEVKRRAMRVSTRPGDEPECVLSASSHDLRVPGMLLTDLSDSVIKLRPSHEDWIDLKENDEDDGDVRSGV